jgi:hypothetical protein
MGIGDSVEAGGGVRAAGTGGDGCSGISKVAAGADMWARAHMPAT